MNLHRYLNTHYFYFVFPYFKFYKYFCQIIKLVFSLPSRFLFFSAVNLSVFSFSVTPEMLFFQNLKLWQLTPRPFGITLLNVSSGCAALWFAVCARGGAARRARECTVGGAAGAARPCILQQQNKKRCAVAVRRSRTYVDRLLICSADGSLPDPLFPGFFRSLSLG